MPETIEDQLAALRKDVADLKRAIRERRDD
jgi:hypothetical protein